jgi:tellurite resistance protein TerC
MAVRMPQEPPREPPKIVKRLREQQERHRERPKVVRGLAVAVGFTLLLGGALLLVLPGPAFVVIPIGLAILALEFQWADNLLEKSLEQADRAKEKAAQTTTTQRVISGVAIALGAAAVVAWAIVGDIPLVPV